MVSCGIICIFVRLIFEKMNLENEVTNYFAILLQVLLCRSLRFLQKFFSNNFSRKHPIHDIAISHTVISPTLLSGFRLHGNILHS